MSPGFEVNDAGYSTQTDRAGGHAMVQYRKLTPSGWTRERYVWVSKWWTWNYGNESPGRRLAGVGVGAVQELLAVHGTLHLREARVGRQAHARRPDGDSPRQSWHPAGDGHRLRGSHWCSRPGCRTRPATTTPRRPRSTCRPPGVRSPRSRCRPVRRSSTTSCRRSTSRRSRTRSPRARTAGATCSASSTRPSIRWSRG